MKYFLRLILLSLFAAGGLKTAAARAIVYHPGIYCLGATDQAIPSADYDSAYVSGGAVRVSWALLEPAEGSYDWSYLDQEIATARSHGKYISIFFGGAFKSPAWLLNNPAIHFFVFQNGTQTVRTPLPYDSVYLAKLCRFITAFGARYRDSATVAYVRGATESVTQGWGLPGIDTAGRTLAGYYHYTTDTLLHAMQRVLDTFMKAFPATPEWIEVGKLPFDTLGGHHDIYTGEQIAAYGFAKYPDRFNVWREDFNACFPLPPDTLGIPRGFRNSYWHILWEHPCHNGAQAVWNLQDVSCTTVPRMDMCDPAQCSKDTVLWRAARRTLRYGMTYLEIYAGDIQTLSLNHTLQKVADSLAANAAACYGRSTGVGNASSRPGAFAWNVYPNPAATEVWIEAAFAGNAALQLQMHDMTGRIIKTIPLSANKRIGMDISGLPEGVYMLELQGGGTVYGVRRLCVVR